MNDKGETRLAWLGGVLMVSGGAIAVVALLWFGGLGERVVFVGVGLLVEVLGVGLLANSYTLNQGASETSAARGGR